jgi:hypothetical protein
MFGKYSEAFGLSDKTFDKDWKKANERIKEFRDEVNKAKLNTAIKEEVKAVKKAILTKNRALEILTEIAEGKAKKVEERIIMPTFGERKGAIETIMKIEGWEAPKKTENTNINTDVNIPIKEWLKNRNGRKN